MSTVLVSLIFFVRYFHRQLLIQFRALPGNTFFFPFDDIVSIGRFHENSSLNGSCLGLTKIVSSYQESLASKACCLVFRRHDFVLEYENDPQFFRLVVKALKMLHERGLLALAPLPEFIEAI
jgi:hypothetical protein